MACIQGIKKDARLRTSNLTDDDTIRPMTKSSLEEISEKPIGLL
jgi:hypothetical protein